MQTPLFELYNVFAPENEKERTNVWQTKVRSFVGSFDEKDARSYVLGNK
jgi:hypothetical protein